MPVDYVGVACLALYAFFFFRGKRMNERISAALYVAIYVAGKRASTVERKSGIEHSNAVVGDGQILFCLAGYQHPRAVLSIEKEDR